MTHSHVCHDSCTHLTCLNSLPPSLSLSHTHPLSLFLSFLARSLALSLPLFPRFFSPALSLSYTGSQPVRRMKEDARRKIAGVLRYSVLQYGLHYSPPKKGFSAGNIPCLCVHIYKIYIYIHIYIYNIHINVYPIDARFRAGSQKVVQKSSKKGGWG